MGGGSWNGNGDIPAHPSAWCKANQGWVSVVVQSANANVTIPDVKSSNTVYRLWKNGTGGNEYFLVENRQKTKYDQKLPGEGLLIWHIDESISGNSNEIHPKVKLMQADGSGDLESGTNRGDTGDPYPGSSNNKSFTNATTPSSKSYAGANTCVAVTNVSSSGATMTARLSVKCAVVKQKDFKEFQEKHFINEKFAFKELEKPNIDKSVGMDKFTDKFTEKFTEGGFGGGFGGFGGGGMRTGAQPPYFGDPHAGVEPFIGSNLRPDLSTGALTNEEDLTEMQTQMEIGSAESKRVFDSKLPEV
jgi:immune inhibitor A